MSVGAASVLAMYSYGGYNQVCNIGDEIENPRVTIPRSIVLSTFIVAALYMLMTIVILGMIPWQEVKESRTVASLFIERTFSDPATGRIAGMVMTGLILFVAAASLYATILGYSRIPYAAARDGDFFKAFAHVHPKKGFPDVSLVTIAIVSIPFCFFSLGQLVSWLIQVQVLLRFIWQCAAVILLRRYRPDIPQPFTMWLYPWPAILSGALWLFIFFTGPWEGIVFSVAFLLRESCAYLAFQTSRHGATEARKITEPIVGSQPINSLPCFCASVARTFQGCLVQSKKVGRNPVRTCNAVRQLTM